MPQQQKSPELTVFLEKWRDISEHISDNIYYDLGARAFAMGLIPQTTRMMMLDPASNLPANVRTSLFMNELKCSIEVDPKKLEIFIDMLNNSNSAYYATLIRDIRKFFHVYTRNLYMHYMSCALKTSRPN